MPRRRREKHSEAIFHIMCRSISEFMLFREDEDKDYYLGLLKKYTDKYKCSVYAYCLMDNHLHIQLDPKGFDVSKFMQSTNTAYVRYYNAKYKRHGHVFQGRFGSRILDTNEYNLAVSAYIHNNPHDIEGFKGKEESYLYSSYGIYLGIREDHLKLIDTRFIMKLFDLDDKNILAEKYFGFVSHQRDVGSLKQLRKELSDIDKNEYISGRQVILRDMVPAKVMTFISSKLMVPEKSMIAAGLKQKLYEYRAFTAYVLKTLCGLGYKEICKSIYNITISGCSHLCSKGYEITDRQGSVYMDIFRELVSYKV